LDSEDIDNAIKGKEIKKDKVRDVNVNDLSDYKVKF